jgi:hypothetical protein
MQMRKDKPTLVVNPVCIYDGKGQPFPGYQEWYEKAEKLFDIVHYECGAFLTISPRAIQFRGDWSVWWLDPDKLIEFKAWNEKQRPLLEASDGSDEKANSGTYTKG